MDSTVTILWHQRYPPCCASSPLPAPSSHTVVAPSVTCHASTPSFRYPVGVYPLLTPNRRFTLFTLRELLASANRTLLQERRAERRERPKASGPSQCPSDVCSPNPCDVNSALLHIYHFVHICSLSNSQPMTFTMVRVVQMRLNLGQAHGGVWPSNVCFMRSEFL